MTLTSRLERLPPVLAQLEQWNLTAQRNFEDGGQERKSLQELYDYLLRTIANSKHMVLKDESDDVKDLQDFETTHFGEDQEEHVSNNVVMEFLKKVTSTEAENALHSIALSRS